MPKAKAISKIAKESAEIIGANDFGKIKPGIISSIIVWNGDPFSLNQLPITSIAEGKVVYKE